MTRNQRLTKNIKDLKNGGVFSYAARCAWHLNDETPFIGMMREVVNDPLMEESVRYCLTEEIISELKTDPPGWELNEMKPRELVPTKTVDENGYETVKMLRGGK